MPESRHPVLDLLKNDPRYTLEAYHFVRDALSYAQDVLEMGSDSAAEETEELPTPEPATQAKKQSSKAAAKGGKGSEKPRAERHLTGQELCHAIRQYALDQYGMMSRVVLNSWGVHSTSDVGNIVYNLIDIGLMRKSKEDRREDFDDVYDFQEAFENEFQITSNSNG